MTTYEKYINNDFQNSTFWKNNISNDIDTNDYTFKINSLVKYKNAIANFVQILTGKNIPVKYVTKVDGYTDGKSVTISGDINKKNFDSVVGLALHEGSHIVLSEFGIFKDLTNILYNSKINIPKKEIRSILKSIHNSKNNIDVKIAIDIVRSLTNYIEDRRIDKYIQDTCPGYVGYYESLYFKYFNNPLIDKMLQGDDYRDETLDSYISRILNFTNEKSDLDALIGLRDIYNTMDIKNIKRLTSTTDSLKLAGNILKILMSLIKDFTTKSKSSPDPNSEMDLSDEEIEQLANNLVPSDSNGNSHEIKLSPKSLKKLNKLLNEQKKFIQGTLDKKSISELDSKKIDLLSSQKAIITNVHNHTDTCLVIDNVTIEKFYSDEFPFSNEYMSNEYQVAVSNGIRLGNILRNKLKIRNEENVIQYFNKEFGRINKRQLYSATFNNTFFKQSVIEKYGKCVLHICIDMSGSMSGSKIENVITCTTAIARAIENIENIELQISLRSTVKSDNVLAIVYDTLKGDTFKKIISMFPNLKETGGTPEGLCFEALLNYLVSGNINTQSVFINFSDGEPTYTNGVEHTREMVKKITDKNIEVLSYFIQSTYNSSLSDFKRMYGKNAIDIDITNIANIAKTINEKLLLK